MSRTTEYRIQCQRCPAEVSAAFKHCHVFIDCKRYVEAMAVQQQWVVEGERVRCMVHREAP